MDQNAHGSGSGHPLAPFPPEAPTDPDTRRDFPPARAVARPPPSRGELFVRTGPVAGLRFALRDGVISAGRSSHCDLPLHDPAVSRRHFELEVTLEGVWLRDLGSGNGTRLNGRRVEQALLQRGDRILAGNSTLEFREAPLEQGEQGTSRDASGAERAPRPLRWRRLSLAIGLPGLAAVSLASAAAVHRRHLRQDIARQSYERGLAELAGDPPDPELALADFLASEPDAPDRRALRDAMAEAQDMGRAIQQLARARELSDRKDFAQARRELLGLPASGYFDRMAQAISREIEEREAALPAVPRRPVPVIRSLQTTNGPASGIGRGSSEASEPRAPARSRKAPAKPAARLDDDRAEQLCDDADALLAQNPEAARRKYREALELAHPGSPAARRAEGGVTN